MIDTNKVLRKIKLNVKTILENVDVFEQEKDEADVVDDEPRNVPEEKPAEKPQDVPNKMDLEQPTSEEGDVETSDMESEPEPEPEPKENTEGQESQGGEENSALTADHENAIQTWLLDKDAGELTNESFLGFVNQRNANVELSYNFVFKMAKKRVENKLNNME